MAFAWLSISCSERKNLDRCSHEMKKLLKAVINAAAVVVMIAPQDMPAEEVFSRGCMSIEVLKGLFDELLKNNG